MKQIRNLVNIGSGDIIGNGISAAFWFYLAILMSPSSYGELNYLISIAGIVSYFGLIGAQNTITVYVAKKIPIQSTLNFISLVVGIISFILLYLLFQRIEIGFLVLGYIISNLAIGELLGKKEYKNYFIHMLIQKSLTPILGLSLFFILGVDGIIYGLAFSNIAFLIIIIKSFRKIKIDFTLLTNRKGFIANNYFIALGGTLHSQIDKILIIPILGAAILGNYALSLQILAVMMIIPSVFFKFMLPEESSGNDIEKMRKLLIFTGIILTLIGYFLIPIFLPIIFPEYIETIDTIKIMSFAIIPISLIKLYTSKFLSMEKSKYVLSGFLISLSILIPTMILLGTWFEILGIATAYVFSVSILALYFYIISRKISKGENIASK